MFRSFPLFQKFILRLFFLSLTTVTASAQEQPWRLSDSLGLDGNFTLRGHQRTRYESLNNNPRVITSKNDQMLVFRTAIDARYDSDWFRWQIELQDQRQQGATDDSVVGTSIVNVTDVLQAHVGFKLGHGNSNTDLKIGRFTTDWGSRRLVARNRFRNTINSFDGVEIVHDSPNGNTYKAMYTRPVIRLPFLRSELLDNEHKSDESSEAWQFWGLAAELPELIEGFDTELTYLGLREKNTDGYVTPKRHLDTFSLRLLRSVDNSNWSFESETAYQTGHRVAPISNLTTDTLDHEAWFQHFTVGYDLRNEHEMEISFLFDYANGDDEPLDTEYNRFDSLFGVTRPELGPGGLYGAYSRSNIITPGLRLNMKPTTNTSTTITYRHFWLESDTDFWGRTGQRDLSGDSDKYNGSHFEVRYRWEAIPGNLRVEFGGIWMDPKNFVDDNTLYGYAATIITF